VRGHSKLDLSNLLCVNSIVIMQTISPADIRYSQASVDTHFKDRATGALTPVEAWANALPYTASLQVVQLGNGEYLSFDNRRLYSAKNYAPAGTPLQCHVLDCNSPPSDTMKDLALDQLEIAWVDVEGVVNRLTLTALLIEGVFLIRCVTQDSAFPADGRKDPEPSVVGRRAYDEFAEFTWKIRPAGAKFTQEAGVNAHTDSLAAATQVYVRIRSDVNVYHRRDDLQAIILGRDDLFEVTKYEKGNVQVKLEAGGDESGSDVSDDWDEVLGCLAERETATTDEYESEFFQKLGGLL
jgi:hypothetical protein